MKINTLKTFGDGFAKNHYWPMWSQLLAEILQCQWKNFSLPGLGNEAMCNLVTDELAINYDSNDFYVIQWTGPPRLDLEINQHNQDIKQIISQDPVYYDNYITTATGRTYWSSSASISEPVKHYREFLTQSQHQSRSIQSIMATTWALTQKQAQWLCMFTYDAIWAKNVCLPEQNVIWPSLQDFLNVSQYRELDVGEIQPVTSIHLDFLETYVLPKFSYNTQHFQQLKQHYIEQDRQRKLNGDFIPWDRDLTRRADHK